MRYTNKFVEFLNGANTIIIRSPRDFNSLKSLCKKVGLDCFGPNESYDYYDLYHYAQVNGCLIDDFIILVEYQPYKGFSYGYKTFEESEKWYGLAPWTMEEVRESME